MGLHSVLIEAALLCEGSTTELAMKFFPIMPRLPMCFEVTLPVEFLSALWTVVDLCLLRVLLSPMSREGTIALEPLAAVKTRGPFQHSRLFWFLCGS